jgi:hypothetical protein
MSNIHEYDLVALNDAQAATHKTSLETIQLQRSQIGTSCDAIGSRSLPSGFCRWPRQHLCHGTHSHSATAATSSRTDRYSRLNLLVPRSSQRP